MKKYEADLVAENRGFTKKELLKMSVKKDKLERALGGISEMKKVPDLVFIIDTNYESLAIAEASKLGIPICAILDSNSNPDGIDSVSYTHLRAHETLMILVFRLLL